MTQDGDDRERSREAEGELTIDLLGWPSDGPTLRLDYERFSYAGKFVMSNTGKAVLREERGERLRGDDDSRTHEREGFDDDVVAAVAFNEDRTDPDTLWLRYVTVRADSRGEGLGPRLIAFVRDRALERGYDRLRIAVNNPFAYEALVRAGFRYTGETTGLAEVVLEFPVLDSSDAETYRRGLAEFRGRDQLTDEEAAFVEEKYERGPPAGIDASPVDDGSERGGESDANDDPKRE